MQGFMLRYYVWLNPLIHYADKQRFHLAGDFMKTPPLRRGRKSCAQTNRFLIIRVHVRAKDFAQRELLRV